MKKVLLAILILALSITAAAKPVQVSTVESVSENTAFSDSSSASLTEETDILGELIFSENFDTDNIKVSGDSADLASGQSWSYVSSKVTDGTLGYTSFRFLRGDSGYNGSALLTRQTDGDNGYMWVRTDSTAGTTYPGFVFQFRNGEKSIALNEGTYTLCMKVYSPTGNGISSSGIRERVTDGVDAYGYRSGNLIDPSTTWETYLPAEQGTWSYIWSTYTASESKPLSGFYVMNNGGNAEGKADFRSFYIDDISLYYIPSNKTATNSYTFTFVDGENQTTKTVDELTKVTLPTPFSDKTFLGWAETQNGEPLSNTTLIALCDKTLYAVWGEEIKTNPVTNVDFFANAPLDAASAVYGNETTLKNFTTGASTCNVTHAILRDSDGTDYRRFLAQADGDLKFQFSYGVDNASSYVAFDDTKGAVVKLRLNVPTDSTQPSGNLTVKNIFSLKEGGFLDPAATAYIDTSVVGKWQYVYFDYSSISGKNGSMRRFDVFGLKDGWSIDVDYIHFILDDDVVYSVLTPQITVETKGENGYVKYTFDGECALSSTEFDAIAGGHGFGTSTKTADENGNSVYTYTTTLNNVSGTALPSVVKGVSVEAGKLSGIYLPYVRFNKIQPTTIQLASMRIDPNGTYQGVRYMGYTTSDMKADAKEIGFIIAIADNVSDINDLRFGENPVEGQGNVNEAGIKYVYGSAYLKDSHDKIYANTSAEAGIDGDSRYTDMSGYFFTAVLVGITEDKYETKFVGRPYVKIGTEYFYGEPVTRNIKEVAKAVADGGYKGLDDAQKAYINNILGIN